MIAVATLFFATSGAATVTDAAEIRVLCPVALRPAMSELLPTFEKSSSNKVLIVYSAAGDLANRVDNGEAVDVLIATQAQIEDLTVRGKVKPGTFAKFVNVPTGVSVLKGAPKPDISSVDAFKRTMLTAKSIAYIDPAVGGPVGIYLVALLERLGIGAELKPKTVLTKGPVSQAVLKGDAQMGISAVSEIMSTPEVDFVGRLPTAIEFVSYFAAGTVATSREADAANAMIGFLTSPSNHTLLKSKGMEPG